MKLCFLIALLFFVPALSGGCSEAKFVDPAISECMDKTVSEASVDRTLDTEFFHAKVSSYPFYVIEHDDGHLENTLGEKVTAEDAIKVEHTAKCISSHQGEHLMSFCEAKQFSGGLLLEMAGGLPAYASSLTLQIDKDKKLRCRFFATYPMTVPDEKLTWSITKKTFKMTSDKFDVGTRLLGWLSVEFDESCTIDGKVTTKSYKIEGYVKPIIQKSTLEPTSSSERAATNQPLPAAEFR